MRGGAPDRPADLAYTITGHCAQGRTVWQGNALITGAEDRNWAYVAVSRGAEGNYVWVVGQPPRWPTRHLAPGRRPSLTGMSASSGNVPGSRPEEREPPPETGSPASRSPYCPTSWSGRRRILSPRGAAAGTWPTLITWQSSTRSGKGRPGRIDARYGRLLREHLPEDTRGAKLSGPSTWLWRTLRGAESAGLDAGTCSAGRSIPSRYRCP